MPLIHLSLFSKVDPEANLTTQDKIFLANVEEVRAQTKIAPEFWKYVNDSAFFSETDMTLVQVFSNTDDKKFKLNLFVRVHFLAKF